jgi:hypothetical protein
MCFRQEKYFLNVLVQPFMPHTQWKFGSLRWHLPMWLSSCWKVTAKKVSHILQLQGIYAFVYRATTECNEKHWLKYLALFSALYRISFLCIYFRNSLYHAYLKLQHATFIATWSTSYMPTRVTCLHQWERVDFWRQLCRSKRPVGYYADFLISYSKLYDTEVRSVLVCVRSQSQSYRIKRTVYPVKGKLKYVLSYSIESRNRSHAL